MADAILPRLFKNRVKLIFEGVAEVSQVFLQDTHVLPTLVSYEEQCKRDRW
jgi:hypothetical protein